MSALIGAPLSEGERLVRYELESCPLCKGQGWTWRTPAGFSPFFAGGFATARAMTRATCSHLVIEGPASAHLPKESP